MSATILSGRTVRDSIIPELQKRVRALPYTPTLAIIQVGDRADSTAFIEAKKKFAKTIGVAERHIQLPVSISEKDLIKKIEECNSNTSIHAIIVQLPLPEHIDRTTVIEKIDPAKDADGLTSHTHVMGATARGIRELLNFYSIALKNKKVAVVGRSFLVGKPIADMCQKEGAIVTVCHRDTTDLVKETASADVLIVATGKQDLIRTQHVRTGQIVVDVGINRSATGQLVGDVNYAEVCELVGAITPVPGGVGPMTVCALFENVLDLCVAHIA